MAYLLSGNMDSGSVEFQLEAAISKIYASVSCVLLVFLSIRLSIGSCLDGC